MLAKGDANRVEPARPAGAVRGLLENILFFAQDRGPVVQLFQAACEFASRIPVYGLTVAPDTRVWEMIA